MPFRLFCRLALLAAFAAISALAQCTFTVTPTSASFSNSSNDSVIPVTASAPTCAWTSRSNTSWITVSFGQTGTGNGTVGFTVTQNNTPTQRTGSLTIAGITFNVTQAAAPCSYSFSPSNATVSFSGASGSFNVITACTWTAATNSPDWITVTGAGTGNGTVQYTAAANLGTTSRTATISAGTATFTITQSASCTYTLNPFTIQADPNGVSGTFTSTASASTCAWTSTNGNPDFITITSALSGTGNVTMAYTIQANRTLNARSGTINIGASVFSVYQPGGTACTYALSAPSASFTSTGGTGAFTVTSTCPWTPTANAAWVTIGGPAASTGNGTVTFGVAPNSSSLSRSATILIGTQSFTLNQAGVACGVTVGQNSIAIPAGGFTGSIDVMSADGCSWNATAGAAWITLGSAGGSAQGSVAFTATANVTPQTRTGNITIANQVVQLTQDGAVCGLGLTPQQASLPATGGTFSLNVATACAYTAVANTGWIKILAGAMGSTTTDVSYSVSVNTSPDARTGTITVGSQAFTISQSGSSCTLRLGPGSAEVSARGGTGGFDVTATGSCRWQPQADAGWLHFTFASINGNGKVNFTADATDQSVPRVANLTVADQIFQVRQAGRPVILISQAGVLNAASFAAGPVSAGEIITIFGSGLGPETGVPLQLTADQQALTQTLAGVRVLFDGVPAPLIYVSSTQVSAIVPYAVVARTTTQMQVEYQGFPSGTLALDVAPTSPALFTLNGSGAGPGAILNQNGTVNTAANPAARNSVIVLFATGEGQTVPPGVDGRLARTPLIRPVAPVSAQVGGLDAKVTYAGGAPGLPAGVLQVNVQLPAGLPSGDVLVVLKIGVANSGPGVTVVLQ